MAIARTTRIYDNQGVGHWTMSDIGHSNKCRMLHEIDEYDLEDHSIDLASPSIDVSLMYMSQLTDTDYIRSRFDEDGIGIALCIGV